MDSSACPAVLNIEDQMWVFECPHCHVLVQVANNETNCRIFRHAVHRTTHDPIDPHTSADECQRLLAHDLVMGCAGPFQLVLDDEPRAVVCGYI